MEVLSNNIGSGTSATMVPAFVRNAYKIRHCAKIQSCFDADINLFTDIRVTQFDAIKWQLVA